MRTALAALAALTLTGCTSLVALDQSLEAGAQAGSQVVDNLNAKALWQLCEGSTLGGYQRLAPGLRAQVDALCVARGGPWTAPGVAQ